MLFNSVEFLLFLPLVFIAYWFLVNKNLKVQNAFLLAISYLFYAWWDWRYLFLIIFCAALNYFAGIALYKAENIKHRKIILGIAMVLSLGLLGVFKYYNFFVDNFITAFSGIGIELHPRTLNIILPVGISFFTFQTLSYTIDVYRMRLQPTTDAVAFFTFVAFFPQLVAGPIERASNLLPQFFQSRKFSYPEAVNGMRQILWGFFKKIVVADNCANFVDQIYTNYETLPGSALVIGAVFFSFQIYGDFSGYSDIAIGTSRLFGFKLMRNFGFPYFTRDIAEFWRHWHISLTTWFRDYLYIPLGGSRGTKGLVIRNTFIIFLVSGFWHGANWTFIVWGLVHAIFFLPLLLGGNNRKNLGVIAENSRLPGFTELRKVLTTFALVTLAWVFFRASNVGQAFDFLNKMFDPSIASSPGMGGKLLFPFMYIAIMLAIEWFNRRNEHGLFALGKFRLSRIALYLLLALMCIAQYEEKQDFIYFQF
jgi:D-alanyl-lipoteichoic acid acyltransferase DltB (MBOAT superfamily)